MMAMGGAAMLAWSAVNAQMSTTMQQTETAVTDTAVITQAAPTKMTMTEAINITANQITDERYRDLMIKNGIQKNIGEVNYTYIKDTPARIEIQGAVNYFRRIRDRLGLLSRSLSSSSGVYRMGTPGKAEDRELLQRLVDVLNAPAFNNLDSIKIQQ